MADAVDMITRCPGEGGVIKTDLPHNLFDLHLMHVKKSMWQPKRLLLDEAILKVSMTDNVSICYSRHEVNLNVVCLAGFGRLK